MRWIKTVSKITIYPLKVPHINTQGSVKDGIACWDSGLPKMQHANAEKKVIAV